MGWSTHHPVGLIYSAPQQCYRGYTLVITTRGNYHANLVDMEGRVCHRWHSPELSLQDGTGLVSNAT